ncbi:hypothetical protein Tco_1499205 [Tanacetum coccineum]
MKTKRKLVSKSIGIGNSACSVKRNVLDQDVCDNVAIVDLRVSPKRQCIRQSTSAPPYDQELELPQVLPVGSIVFPNTCVHNISSVKSNVFPQDICGNIGTVNLSVSLKRRWISTSVPSRDFNWNTSETPPANSHQFVSQSKTTVQAYLLLAISDERPAPDKLLIMICDKDFLTAFCKHFCIQDQVPWSNERLLENKELNAIIGAWFTLWRD